MIVKSGSCPGKFILRCRANNYWASSYYQDRVITVSAAPNPCAPTINIYPNPTNESEFTTLQMQYPCIEEVNSIYSDI